MKVLCTADDRLKEPVSEIKEELEKIKYQSPFYDTKGASKFLGISRARLYGIIANGQINHYKNRSGRIRFSKSQLEDFESYIEVNVSSRNNLE